MLLVLNLLDIENLKVNQFKLKLNWETIIQIMMKKNIEKID
jgi:hypothetical protein